MATDYISREAAIDAVNVGNLHRGIINALQEIISDIPAADVVEVVRCKDCKYYLPYEVDGTDGKCKRWNGLVVYDDYCSSADMREVTPCSS